MSENNESLHNTNENNLESSTDITANMQPGETVNVQGTTFTKEEIEQANKPQPNVILDVLEGLDTKTNRDNDRVERRANESPDSNDSNSGGIISGGAKGVNQS